MNWGTFWKATVRNVLQGRLVDREITWAVGVNLTDGISAGRFHGLGNELGVKLRFRRMLQDPATLQGFTAADGKRWELIDIDGD